MRRRVAFVLFAAMCASICGYVHSAAATDAAAWQPPTRLNESRYLSAVVPLDDGKIFVIGGIHYGSDGFRYLASTEVYDPATRTWSTRASMQSQRGLFVGTRLLDGRVLVTKGNNGSGAINDTSEIYDPIADAWSPAASLPGPYLGFAAAATMPSGRAFFFGYETKVYSAATDSWSDFAAPLLINGAVQLPNGDVFAVGQGEAAVLNAGTETWTSVPGLVNSQREPEMTVLPDGRVFVATWSGYDDSQTSGLFDPSTGAWTTAAPTSHPVKGAAVGAMPDGRVALFGGYTSSTTTYSGDLALYSPTTNSWTAGPPLDQRTGAMAAATRYGVLFIGGSSPTFGIETADEFAMPPRPELTVADASSAEGGPLDAKAVSFTIVLDAPVSKPIHLQVVTANGTAGDDDYQGGVYKVTVPHGKSSVTVQIPIKGDLWAESDESFSIEVRDPVTKFVARATGTILNDDASVCSLTSICTGL